MIFYTYTMIYYSLLYFLLSVATSDDIIEEVIVEEIREFETLDDMNTDEPPEDNTTSDPEENRASNMGYGAVIPALLISAILCRLYIL